MTPRRLGIACLLVCAAVALWPEALSAHGVARGLKVQSYEKQENDFSSGTLTAPFTDIHGWYWENAGERDLTITLTTSGFYTAAEELRPRFDPVKHKDRVEHVPHELQTPAGFTEPPSPRR